MSKEEQMRAAWEQWRASGKSRARFAREQQIPINTFHYWCRRFEGKRPTVAERRRQAQGNGRLPDTAKSTAPAFVEIATGAPSATSTAGTSAGGPTPRMRFDLPDGTSITIY